jgi:hypothetical protein
MFVLLGRECTTVQHGCHCASVVFYVKRMSDKTIIRIVEHLLSMHKRVSYLRPLAYHLCQKCWGLPRYVYSEVSPWRQNACRSFQKGCSSTIFDDAFYAWLWGPSGVPCWVTVILVEWASFLSYTMVKFSKTESLPMPYDRRNGFWTLLPDCWTLALKLWSILLIVSPNRPSRVDRLIVDDTWLVTVLQLVTGKGFRGSLFSFLL